MPYSTITNNRIAYQLDGTTMFYKTAISNSQWDIGVATKLNSTQMDELNDEDITVAISTVQEVNAFPYLNLWFFFPEKRTIASLYTSDFNQASYLASSSFSLVSFEASNDTTNGMDGTWEAATFPSGKPETFNPIQNSWRTDIKPVSLSTAYRAVRALFTVKTVSSSYYSQIRLVSVHLYGSKAVGEQPDDLVFCETDGTEMTALNDFGDRPEASVETDSFKIKNISPDKTATTVNVTVTHTDFLLSLSETGPWTASVDIVSIAANTLSDTIYIKNELGQPPLTLGPKATKIVATIGSWV